MVISAKHRRRVLRDRGKPYRYYRVTFRTRSGGKRVYAVRIFAQSVDDAKSMAASGGRRQVIAAKLA